MKKLREYSDLAVNTLKSPIGLTLLGATVGSVVTHLLGNSHRELELKKTKERLEQANDEMRAINKLLEDVKHINQSLLIKLRDADTYNNRTKFDLLDCNAILRLQQHAFDNSYCFYRHKTTNPSLSENSLDPINIQPSRGIQ